MSLIASLAFMTGCSAAAEPGAAPEASAPAPEAASSEAAAPTPDVSGIPEIIAEVNGEKITKADFTRIYEGQFAQVVQQAQLSGQELDQKQLRKQTAEGLVNTELLIQQAAKKKIFATAKDLDQALADVAKSNDMDTKEFLATMDKQGLNEDSGHVPAEDPAGGRTADLQGGRRFHAHREGTQGRLPGGARPVQGPGRQPMPGRPRRRPTRT